MRHTSKRAAANVARHALSRARHSDIGARLGDINARRADELADMAAARKLPAREALAVLRQRRAARGLPVDDDSLLRLLGLAAKHSLHGTRWSILQGRTRPRSRPDLPTPYETEPIL